MMPEFEWLRPRWLLLALFLVPWLVYGFRRSLVDFSRGQRRLSLVVRTLLVLLLVLALSGLTWNRAVDQRFLVVGIDRSASVGDGARQAARAFLESFRPRAGDTQMAAVEFNERPGKLRSIDSDGPLDPSGTDGQPVDDSRLATDLAAMIRFAQASVPAGYVPQLLLFSDGRETTGDALTAARLAGLPVSVVPVQAGAEPQVQVAGVHAPEEVRAGEPFMVEIEIAATQPQTVRWELYRDELRVETGEQNELALRPGINRVEVRQQVDEPQTASFTARVMPVVDSDPSDNQASSLVIVSGQPRVLIVDAEPETLTPLQWALEDQQIAADVRPSAGMPATLPELLAFDAIVLSDVAATAFSADQLENLKQYVARFGGGLMMIGGEHSFGLGGYSETPLEDVLPVHSDPQREREQPSLAMVLVIDRSGSMGGMKLELAQDAARGALELLGPRDQIAILAFDDAPYWVNPLQAVADKATIVDRLERLTSAGGTNLYPALAEARDALSAATAKLKHLIVLTDGISAPADFAGMIADLAAEQITVSTVAVGDKADRGLLEMLAEQGSGRHYVCDDPRAVPQIFAQETLLASKSAIEETPFLPVAIRATPVLRGIDLEGLPLLLGMVMTRPKPTSELILTGEEGEPLLAWWRYGLGMAAAFTSDAKTRWAAEWLSWPDFSVFWAQSLRHIMRREESKSGELRLETYAGRTRAVLELVDENGGFVNRADAALTLLAPGQDAADTLVMQQTAPGRYETEFESKLPGTYLVDLIAQRDQQLVFRQTRGRVLGYPDELRIGPANESLLRQLADSSGGIFAPRPEDLLTLQQPSARRPLPLWPYFLIAALILLLIDVALRRLEVVGDASDRQREFPSRNADLSVSARSVTMSAERPA